MSAPWIGVDLDGTLAEYHGWKGVDHIGEPIRSMVTLVKRWRAGGKEVRIFTARVANGADARPPIEAWCLRHIGEVLPITNVKDFGMVELWDDRAVGVETNMGCDGATFLPSTPDEVLDRSAELFRSRNAEYGNSYQRHGDVMKALFPNGVMLRTVDDFVRMGLFNMVVGKILRTATNFEIGGHLDSSLDLSVYAAMLNSVERAEGEES